MISSLMIVLAAGAVQAAELPALDKDPRSMSQSEIRAFNVGRSVNDPDFIRCVRAEETGSLVRKSFVCHTSSQWAELQRQGNQAARDTFESMQSKSGNLSN